MDRAQKEVVVGEHGQIFADSGVVVVARYEGMSVAEMTDFRLRMKQAGGAVRVAKNKLARIALKGTPSEKMGDLLTGMTVLAYSVDPVAAAKAAVDFAKTNDKLEIVGGSMGGQLLDEAGIKALASMPSLDELRGKLVGLINAPATKIAQVVNAPAAKLARVFGAYGAKEAA